MKKFNVTIQRGKCSRCNTGEATLTVSGSIYSDGHVDNLLRIIEHKPCYRKEISEPSRAEREKALEILGIKPVEVSPQTLEDILLPKEMLEQIEKEKKQAITRGWDASKSDWRTTALRILCETCLTLRKFTVNDFRNRIKESRVTTHDNRAMGGLMTTALRLGWIEASGDEVTSQVGHKSKLQVWDSKVYQELSARERKAERQQLLFAK